MKNYDLVAYDESEGRNSQAETNCHGPRPLGRILQPEVLEMEQSSCMSKRWAS